MRITHTKGDEHLMSYLEPHQPRYNFLQHLVLVGGGPDHTVDTYLDYAAHRDVSGTPDGWMFDGFLFFDSKSPQGNDLGFDINIGTTMSGEGDFYAVPSPNPSHQGDWAAMIDQYFGEGGTLDRLNQAVKKAADVLGEPPHPRSVVLIIPYPSPMQSRFGRISPSTPSLNFSVQGQNLSQATEARLGACRWYVDQVEKRWADNRDRYPFLHLLGYYWLFESLYRSWDIDDHWLLKELRPLLRERQRNLVWIPFWSTYTVHQLDDYSSYYFDLAFLQFNYLFYQKLHGVSDMALAAKQRGAGIEMEYFRDLEEPIAVAGEKHRRFYEYLDGGARFGYMTESAMAWFQGGKAFSEARRDRDPRERKIYDDVYDFIRGVYKPRQSLA